MTPGSKHTKIQSYLESLILSVQLCDVRGTSHIMDEETEALRGDLPNDNAVRYGAAEQRVLHPLNLGESQYSLFRGYQKPFFFASAFKTVLKISALYQSGF